MRIKELKSTRGFKPCGIYNTGYLGLEVEISNTNEAARVSWSHEEKISRWLQIKYTKSGEPYIRYRGRRYRLVAFMRYPWFVSK